MPKATEDTLIVDESRTLYLIDAMALAYRSHYIFISRPLFNSKGLNTSATYGFTNSLLKLIEKHDMEHIAVVFEGGGGNFREEIYEEYKANRDEMPEELRDNLPYIRQVVEALDIPVLEQDGVEADDVIGTLARRAEEEGWDVVIVSPDKDFKQLLSPHVSIYKPARQGQEFDPITDETFREETELEPLQFIDMLALMGDSSDNVPGVPGIGPKTAMKLLKKYGSVENLIEHADDLSGKRAREGMQNHADDATLSKTLVTIRTDCDVEIDWHELKRRDPHADDLVRLFDELEFKSLLERVQSDDGLFTDEAQVAVAEAAGDPALEFDFGEYEEVLEYAPAEVDYAIVRNRQELEQLAGELMAQDAFAFDTETTSTDQMWASLVGVSVAFKEGAARYVPTPLPDGTQTDEVLEVLRPALESDKLKIAHNAKYDLVVLAQHGVEVSGPFFDTMVAHYLVAPEAAHGLSDVARKYLNYRMIPIEELIGKGKSQVSMRDVAVEDVGPYACEDADITFRLHDLLREALAELDHTALAEDIEFPLTEVLARMERRGIRIDQSVLDEISGQLEERLEELETRIHELAGESFNINSTQQLAEILFDKLDLPVKAKTSTGRPSTKESVLQELSTEHEIPGLVLDYRSVAKLKGTYVDALGELVHPETDRIHTSFNQTVTSTGRLSSSNPNLQNIPVRTAVGREIRKAFVPEEGWTLIAADYVQIELRILASMSGDEALKAAFAEGQDIHTATAARVYGVDPDEITRDMRRKAKEVNYGIPYGVSPWGLAQRLRTPVGEAQELINQYQKSYPGVTRFLNKLVEQAREQGYVETPLGRRRYLPEIKARNSNRRAFAERAAVNMPIQGTQADMIKIAMVRIQRRMDEEGLQARLLLQVHDELVVEAPPEEVEAVTTLLREEMAQAYPLDGVPVEVDIDTGVNWLDAH